MDLPDSPASHLELPLFSPDVYEAPPSVCVEGPIIEAPLSVAPPTPLVKTAIDESPVEAASEGQAVDTAKELAKTTEAETEPVETEPWWKEINDPFFTPGHTLPNFGQYQFANGTKLLCLYKDGKLWCALHDLVIKIKIRTGAYGAPMKPTREEAKAYLSLQQGLKKNFEFKMMSIDSIREIEPRKLCPSIQIGRAHV